MNLRLNETSPEPLYYQVAGSIRAAVECKSLQEGALIGSEHRLARDFRVSVPTIRKAMDLLEGEGIVVRRRGVGTFVAHSLRKQPLTVSFLGDAKSLATAPAEPEKTKPIPRVQHELALNAQANVWHLRRVQTLKGRPVAVLDDYCPERPSREEIEALFNTEASHQESLARTKARLIRHEISAESADTALSHLLMAPEGATLIVKASTAFAWNGNPLAYSRNVYLAETFRFETTI